MIEVRDSGGKVYKRVENPAVVFDKDLWVVTKIGEYGDMVDYYNTAYRLYKESGAVSMADALVLFRLPKDQDIIDKVCQTTGYIKEVYESRRSLVYTDTEDFQENTRQ